MGRPDAYQSDDMMGFLCAVAGHSANRRLAPIVLDDGRTRLAIVVVDSCAMPRSLLDEAKAMAAKSTGIPVENMLISATHTHSAPAAIGGLGTDPDPHYPPVLKAGLVEAIEKAAKNLAPARVGAAVGDAAPYTAVRRWIRRPDRVRDDPFGNPTVRANMHPGYQSPDTTGPAGPTDPDLSVISFQSRDGRRHDVDIRVVLEAEGGPETAGTVSDNAHADLAIRNRLPLLRGVRVGGRFLKTRDRHLPLLSEGRRAQAQRGGAKANRLQKRTS